MPGGEPTLTGYGMNSIRSEPEEAIAARINPAISVARTSLS